MRSRFGFARIATVLVALYASPVAAQLCTGEYADDLNPLSSRVREFERDARNQYSYCLRTVAVYECLSYASDGSLRRARKTVTAHGTGFAYRRTAGETYLLTNEHVASWPAVTDEEHAVEEVPSGCKRVSESIRIVDDEDDGYEANDIALSTVVVDPALDGAILKTRQPLKLIPYKLGKSAALRVGNIVAVHGFPLGAFAATNLGKVVNAYDHDTTHEWDHVDFVTDALLSPGNSGSPVLALSCKTGEYELVGVYHAGYVRGSALNVVVGIDQLRELMLQLKRSRTVETASDKLGPADRQLVRTSLVGDGGAPFFPLGSHVGAVRAMPDGTLWFELYSKSFPLHDERLLLVEDRPPRGGPSSELRSGFGELGRVYVGNRRGLKLLDRGALDADEQAHLLRMIARLRQAAAATAAWRAADTTTARGNKRRATLERQRDRAAGLDSDAAQFAADLSERLGPRVGEGQRLADALAPAAEPAAVLSAAAVGEAGPAKSGAREPRAPRAPRRELTGP